MAQTPQTVLDELKKGVFRPLYFLQGEEPFFIDQIVDYIENNALAESERGFNQLIMYGKDQTIGSVVVQARRFPMMAQRQVVIVREAQELADLNRQEGQELLLKYIMNPVPSTILVFAHKYKKLDGRKELPKLLDKKLTDWIASYVKSQGIIANSGAVQLLSDHIGNDLSRLTNELAKIKITLAANAELTKEIIHEKIGISKDFNGIEFQNAVATKNLAKAIQIARYFVSNPRSSNIIPNLALLFSYFIKVLQVIKNPTLNDNELATRIGVNPFFVKDYKSAGKRFSERKASIRATETRNLFTKI